MSRLRTRRLEPSDALLAGFRPDARPTDWSLAARAGAASSLDLGARIGLAADLQGMAGNRAMHRLVGLVRTDRKKNPPGGLAEIMAASGPGNRGLTRTSYTANPPLFRAGRVEQQGGSWVARPAEVRLPSLDHEVMWPAPGLHKLRSLGKGSQFLESPRTGPTRSARARPSTSRTSTSPGSGRGARSRPSSTRWPRSRSRARRSRRPRRRPGRRSGAGCDLLRPEGETPTAEAQEKKWGADDPATPFRKLMNESKRVRDNQGWHMPDQSLKESRGDDRIDELSVGNSKIGQVTSEKLIGDAWDRLSKG